MWVSTYGLTRNASSEKSDSASMCHAWTSSLRVTGVSGATALGSPAAERERYSPPIECAGIEAHRKYMPSGAAKADIASSYGCPAAGKRLGTAFIRLRAMRICVWHHDSGSFVRSNV